MAFTNGNVYFTSDNGGSSTFGMINKTLGVYSNIATNSVFEELLLASDGVNLYGVKAVGSFQVYQINPQNGATTLIGTPTGATNVFRILGAAAVPEPGTYVLAGIATCVMTFAGRRKLRRCEA